MKTAEEYLKESGYEEGMTWTLEGMKLNMGIFAYERDQEIKDMIDAEIELYEGIIKSTEDKPTKMAFEGSVLALNKIRSKL